MASNVVICNVALSLIGQRLISSMTEISAEASYCNLHLPRVRRSLLRAHTWNFATRVVALAQSAEDPEYGYAYRYTLPSDCLRPIELTNLATVSADASLGYTRSDIYLSTLDGEATVPGVAFKIIGKDLLTNMESAKLAYIYEEDDPNQYDDVFIDAMAYRLAAVLAGVFPESATMQKNMMDLFNAEMVKAKGIDASESKPSEKATLVTVRV